jgi:hypothetical protein
MTSMRGGAGRRGNEGKGEDVVSINMDGRPTRTAAMVTRLHVGEVLGVLRKDPRFRPNYETVR